MICWNVSSKVYEGRVNKVKEILSNNSLTWNQKKNIYIATKHWRALRRKKKDLCGKICERCGSDIKIEVHHKEYRNLYDVELDDLEVLCQICHSKIPKNV